uniref:Uncharacterized protein n=1 Tax=Sphaerodactylus townsendi TaxID=933632 RepID=A0ACB8ESC6_9SAUR
MTPEPLALGETATTMPKPLALGATAAELGRWVRTQAEPGQPEEAQWRRKILNDYGITPLRVFTDNQAFAKNSKNSKQSLSTQKNPWGPNQKLSSSD